MNMWNTTGGAAEECLGQSEKIKNLYFQFSASKVTNLDTLLTDQQSQTQIY